MVGRGHSRLIIMLPWPIDVLFLAMQPQPVETQDFRYTIKFAYKEPAFINKKLLVIRN